MKKLTHEEIQTDRLDLYLRYGESVMSGFMNVDRFGQYTIPAHIADDIRRIMTMKSPMRRIASVYRTDSDCFDIVETNLDEDGFCDAGEECYFEYIPIKNTIYTNDMFAQQKLSDSLLDKRFDIVDWFTCKAAHKFSDIESTSFINGSGVHQPKGILQYPDGKNFGEIEQVKSGAIGGITADALVSLWRSLPSQYAHRASVMMNRTTLESIKNLKYLGTEQYIVEPCTSNYGTTIFFGIEVVFADDMPIASPGSLPIAIGDFQEAYTIVDGAKIRTKRTVEESIVKFDTIYDVGGEVTNFDAIKLLKIQ